MSETNLERFVTPSFPICVVSFYILHSVDNKVIKL